MERGKVTEWTRLAVLSFRFTFFDLNQLETIDGT
jgi:hypothetical protein